MSIDLTAFSAPNLEEAIISYLLQNKSVDTITSDCDKEFFFNSFYKNVYLFCYDYVVGMGRGAVDFPAILDMVRQAGKDNPDNLAYLNKLRALDLGQFPLLDYCIKQLKEFYRRRKFILITNKYLEDAQKPDLSIDKVMADTEEELLDIERGDGNRLELLTGMQIVDRRKKGLLKRMASRMIYSGWSNLDVRLTYGFAPSKVSLIAGRTSMGKSLFKTNLINNMCQNQVGVLNVCPEQGFDSEHDRIDAVLTSIPVRDMAKISKWGEEDLTKWQMLKSASTTIAGWDYSCVPSRNITVAGVQSAIRRFRRIGKKIDIVFIDLFDRLTDVNVAKDRTGNFTVKLSQIARIAQEEDVHMCLLVQINRGTEGRKDHRPTLGDLRDCGNFEQDSDLVLLLYREGYYDLAVEDNILEVNIAKQRDGIGGVTPQFMIIDKNTLQIVPAGDRLIPKKENDNQ
jgi:replicative DNA helicase